MGDIYGEGCLHAAREKGVFLMDTRGFDGSQRKSVCRQLTVECKSSDC